MARIPIYDPLTSEARSPLIAGLTEAVNKLSAVLDLDVAEAVDLPLTPIYVTETDKFRIYQAPNGNRLWLEDPAPVVRRNGIQIMPEDFDTTFTIDYVGGSIAFENNLQMNESDIITVDVTYIVDASSTINYILEGIKRADRFVGYFNDFTSLAASYPTASIGNYAIVGGDDNSVYIWNITTKKWENTFKDIKAHGDKDEDDFFYFGGRKTWQDLRDKVNNTPVSGIGSEDPEEVLDGDTVSVAVGKLQAQVSNYLHDIYGESAPTEGTKGIVGQDYTDRSTGIKYHLTAITEDGRYLWEKYGDVSGIRFQLTIPSDGWADKEVTVNDTRLLSSDDYAYLISSDTSTFSEYNDNGVKAGDILTDGEITFTCDDTPVTDLLANIMRFEVKS